MIGATVAIIVAFLVGLNTLPNSWSPSSGEAIIFLEIFLDFNKIKCLVSSLPRNVNGC